jgi:hypothetical protein
MSDSSGLVIDSSGYYAHTATGERFFPIGVNYWPASCGVELWPHWPEAEIRHDLDLLVSLGLNSIRFFLRWQDFEPEPGQYDPKRFEQLAQMLTWCAERGLYAQPSLFVGWMSGGVFWPKWKAGRNLFADPVMLERSMAFAWRAAEVIAPFHDSLLGIDQGNEICCLSDSAAAPPQAVIHWCRRINEAIRSVYPNCLVISGNEQNQVLNDTGWRFNQQPGTDLYSMHGYPVPAWHGIGFDGMTDPMCQSLLPFYTQIARAFGPVMVQEFGTIVTFGAVQQDTYLRAILPACWDAGANGFLWWCLRDVHASVHPYLKHRFESTLGLVDDQDAVKPGLEYYVEFARTLPERPMPVVHGGAPENAVGLYWPRHYYPRDAPRNPGNHPRQLSRWLVMANYCLRQLGYSTRVIRGDLALSAEPKTMIIPGSMLDALEVQALEEWVRLGGNLIWHGPDPANWGHEYIRLLGAKPVDYRASHPARFEAFGKEWTMGAYPRHMRVELVAEKAVVLTRDQDGLPMLLSHSAGQGRIVYALPIVEASAAEVSDDRQARDRWMHWYAGILDALRAS